MALLPGLPPPAAVHEGKPPENPLLPRWKQRFAWSVSRHRLWLHCHRAFFYEVVAPHLSRPPVPWEELRRLRDLSSFRVIQGQAVHAALEEGIRAALRGDSAEAMARRILDRDLRAFALHPERTLCEAANGQPLDRESLEAARAEGRAMLGLFFRDVWPRYAARRYLQHEEYAGFDARSVPVRLRVDLLTADSDGVLITDWKTGVDFGDADTSLQLSTYALWAMRVLGEPPERLRAELVFLADGSTRGTTRTAAQLQAAEDTIEASARDMLALEDMADATPRAGRHCVECKFARVCREGREELGLTNTAWF